MTITIGGRCQVPAPANAWWLAAVEEAAVADGRSVILTGGSGNPTSPWAGPALLGGSIATGPAIGRPAPGVGVLGAWQQLGARVSAACSPPSPLRPGVSSHMPDYVVAMAPYLRWCLAEPFAIEQWRPNRADVRWADPLGSPQVIRAAFAMPAEEWTAGGLDRSVARRLTEGLLPDDVRLRRARGEQSADLPDLLRRDADRYTEALTSPRVAHNGRVPRHGCDVGEPSPAPREPGRRPRLETQLSAPLHGGPFQYLVGPSVGACPCPTGERPLHDWPGSAGAAL